MGVVSLNWFDKDRLLLTNLLADLVLTYVVEFSLNSSDVVDDLLVFIMLLFKCLSVAHRFVVL